MSWKKALNNMRCKSVILYMTLRAVISNCAKQQFVSHYVSYKASKFNQKLMRNFDILNLQYFHEPVSRYLAVQMLITEATTSRHFIPFWDSLTQKTRTWIFNALRTSCSKPRVISLWATLIFYSNLRIDVIGCDLAAQFKHYKCKLHVAAIHYSGQ
jgi:hypothetical protein